jgi:galactokinase/mevalonate kinase-like predicted kinase
VKSEAIKSDGGKSDYYKITIDGQTFMIEKIIKQVFRNDFDFGNAFKALIRANALIAGGGKEGSTIEYEMNKVKYSADQVVENNE